MKFLTIKYHYKANEKEKRLLKFLCHLSKNLYNATLYKLRQDYFANNKIDTYFSYNNILSSNDNFHLLNTYQSICTIRSAYYMMSNFIRFQRKENVKLPRYLNKYGYYPLYTDQIRVVLHNNKKCIKLPLSNLLRTNKFYKIKYDDILLNAFIKELHNMKINAFYLLIPKVIENNKIHQVRIVPLYNATYFSIEFSYEVEDKEEIELNANTYAGIDIGINNLATICINNGNSFIIDGKRLKSINQLHNKNKARLQSKLAKNLKNSKRLIRMDIHYKNLINDYINKAVKQTVDKIINEKVSHVVIGYNKGLKKNGITNEMLKGKDKKKVNQSFCMIPLAKYINKLKFKLNEVNIDVKIINESYTSKSSFIDNEGIEKKDNYLGKRIYRGLYQASNGRVINADLNAACNILRKSKPNDEIISNLRDSGLTIPYRVQVRL